MAIREQRVQRFTAAALIILVSWILQRRGHLRIDERLHRVVPRIIVATVAMALILVATRLGLDFLPEALRLVLAIAFGGLCFLLVCHWTGAADFAELRRMVSRRRPATEPGA